MTHRSSNGRLAFWFDLCKYTSKTQILTAPVWETVVTLHASLEHLEVQYRRSEKVPESSDIRHFFQIRSEIAYKVNQLLLVGRCEDLCNAWT
jgi:hypothetical protein